MSITLDLSEDLIYQLKQLSQSTGQTIEEIIRMGVQNQLSDSDVDQHKTATGLSDLLKYAGCIDSGVSNAADNPAIDRDLTAEYARTKGTP